MDTRIATCTRCSEIKETIFVIHARPGGHSWAMPDDAYLPETPRHENACAGCLTDNELAQMLHPVAGFVLDTLPRNSQLPSVNIAIETVAAFFKVRNNNPEQNARRVALRAVGFGVGRDE